MKKFSIHSVNGTGFMGYVKTSYADLMAWFGESAGPSSDGKIRATWCVDSPVGMIIIYDYKESRPLVELAKWYVGGHSLAVLKVLGVLFPGHVVSNSDGSKKWYLVPNSPGASILPSRLMCW